MKFSETTLPGSYLIALEPHSDNRGMFARCYCAKEFAQYGLNHDFVQANLSANKRMGTVRGMHMQREPHSEVKLVRAVHGSIYDVIVDMRRESPTFRRWYGAELSSENGLAMYVPEGFAHGYQSLSDGAVAHYLVSRFYEPESEVGYRFDDPQLSIKWPIPVTDVSEKDATWPLISL